MADYGGAINQYDQFTQQQEGADRGIYDFWAQQFQHFNPQAPMVQSQNTLPAFQGAGQDTIAEAQGLLGGKGGVGGVDMNRMNNRIMDSETSRGLKANEANDLGAMNENYRTNEQYAGGGFNRMNQFGGIQGRINELPMDRQGQNLATSDSINSQWNQYENSKPDFFESLAGGLAGAGGTLLGQSLGKDLGKGLGNSFDPSYQYYNMGPS